MIVLPDHLPVLALPAPANADQAELIDKLQAVLEDDGLAVSRVSAPSSITTAWEVVTLLSRVDLALVTGALPGGAPTLVFTPEDASGSRTLTTSFLCRSVADLHSCAAGIKQWVVRCESGVPLAGAVLIGGKSSRMGRPKHLLRHASGETWLERALATLSPFVDELFVSGAGELPGVVSGTPRVEDLPGVEGPLAGLGALTRARPWNSWLVLACDLPNLEAAAVSWLLNQRGGRYRAVIARNRSTGRSEPLLAWYDYRSSPMIEGMIRSGERRISRLGHHDLTAQPWIPDDLAHCWRNVNYPEELNSRGPSGL